MFGGWRNYEEWVEHGFMPCPGFDGTVDVNTDATGNNSPAVVEFADQADDLSGDYGDDHAGGTEPRCVDIAPADTTDPLARSELNVRPYVRTSGRVVAHHDLRLEAMLVAKTLEMDPSGGVAPV
jgi:hypothetical protein